MVNAVGAKDVFLVARILDVQLQAGPVIQVVGGEQVDARVLGGIDAVGAAARAALVAAERSET